ncbi:MAG: 50S ribosomal protein L24 [Bacilli bacterium]|nr:50S ribosomal protein L24 [Bacilli bacterium]
MRIKKGDKVVVIAGAYKGKVGEVLSVSLKNEKVVVSGVNMITKHNKPSQANPEGSITTKEAPIHVSNVALYDSKKKVAVKVAYEFDAEGNKIRVNRKTREALDKKASKKKK